MGWPWGGGQEVMCLPPMKTKLLQVHFYLPNVPSFLPSLFPSFFIPFSFFLSLLPLSPPLPLSLHSFLSPHPFLSPSFYSSPFLLSQERLRRFEDDRELNLVYENL